MTYVQASFRLGKWLPDAPVLNSNGLQFVENAVWYQGAWRGFREYSEQSSSYFPGWQESECLLTGGQFRAVNGTPFNIVISDKRIYSNQQVVHTFPSPLNNRFALTIQGFGDRVLFCSSAVSLTSYNMITGDVEVLTGSEIPNLVAIGINNETLLGLSNNGFHYASINSYNGWEEPSDSNLTSTAGSQQFPDGGAGVAIINSNATYIFQESIIRQAIPLQSSTRFHVRIVQTELGLLSARSGVGQNSRLFFLSNSGFYMLDGEQISHIGYGKVDKWFFGGLDGDVASAVDLEFKDRIIATSYPENKWVIWSYISKNTNRSDNRCLFDKHIIYNYAEDAWGLISRESYGMVNFFGDASLGYLLQSISTDDTIVTSYPIKTQAEFGATTDDTIAIVSGDTIVINDFFTDNVSFQTLFGFVDIGGGVAWFNPSNETSSRGVSLQAKFHTKHLYPSVEMPDLSPVAGDARIVPQYYIRTQRGVHVQNMVAVGDFSESERSVDPFAEGDTIIIGSIDARINRFGGVFKTPDDEPDYTFHIKENHIIPVARSGDTWQLNITLNRGWKEIHEFKAAVAGAEFNYINAPSVSAAA